MLLSEEFLNQYPDFPEHQSELSKFVYYRTYSRWLSDEKRRETWKETCARAVEYNCSLAPTPVKEAEQLFHNMFNLKQFVSGRSLWIGGTEAAKKAPLAGFNCSFLVIDTLQAFADLFYLLMVGTGVGFRILPEDVKKLPSFRNDIALKCFYHADEPWGNPTTTFEHISDKSAKIIVGDSKEGWVTALELYLDVMARNIGDDLKFLYMDFSRIRPKGTPLKTFGGTASGYQSVKEMFEKIHKVITLGAYSHTPINGKLDPIHCLDICNIIGQNVVVGGVRRTAEIAIISPKDEDCINAKRNLTEDKYHRYMSNNSVYLEEQPSKEELTAIFDSIRECGEPGFINVAEAKRRRPDFAGMNPCFSGDTQVLTKEYGYIPIRDIVDMPVKVWNGYEMSEVTPRVTGYDQPMLQISFSNGSTVKCTDYHTFVLKDDVRVQARELKLGDKLEKCEYPVITSYQCVSLFDEKSAEPYVAGFYAGDGLTSKPLIWLYGDKRELKDEFEKLGCVVSEGEERDTVRVIGKVQKHQVPFVGDTVENRLEWLAGLIDSDGCLNSEDGAISISSVNRDFLMEVMYMLQTVGATGTVSLCRDSGNRQLPTNNGTGETKEYFCNKSYRLTISAYYVKQLMELGLTTRRVKLVASPNRNAGRFITVTEIKRIENELVVYCFTEPKNHTGMFNGIMAGQCAEIILPPNAVCNLTTINLTAFVDEIGDIDFDGLELALKLSARAGYRMTCLDLELPEWNEVHHRDRLLGCSLTGYQDFLGMASITDITNKLGELKQTWFLDVTRQLIDKFADEYADELGTPHSLLKTAVKPEGTLSLVANGVSPGLHFQHSPYFIRRIRVNASDPLAKTALKLGWQIHPEVGQTMEDATTLVIDFPCKSPSKKTKFDVSAVEQLDIYRMFQKHYTEQNTSNTITVKPDEWGEVVDYVYAHWNDILAVSFLELNSTYYPLLPYEECTKEEYEELKAKMKPFDPELLNNMEIETRNMGKEFEILDDREGCENGVCPIR